MTGKDFKELLLAMLPSEVVREAALRLTVHRPARALDVVALVWALVLAGGADECGRLASAMRSYIKETGRQTLSRGACYKWFDAERAGNARSDPSRVERKPKWPLNRWVLSPTGSGSVLCGVTTILL